MKLGLIGLVMLLGVVASLVMLVVGVLWAVKSKENRIAGIVVAAIGLMMLLGGAGFLLFGLLATA